MKKLLILLLLPFTMLAQHTIKGNFAVENGYKFGILYRIAPDNVFYVTDSNVNSEGILELQLKEDVPAGMYRLVYNLPQDKHFFDFLYNGKEDIEFNFSVDQVITFIDSNDNTIWSEYRKQVKTYEQALTSLFSSDTLNKKVLKKLLKQNKKWFEKAQDTIDNSFAKTFIDNTQPYIPEEFTDKSTYNENAKKSYLKNLDITNPLIQNSAIPLEQSLKYIFNFVDNDNLADSKKKNIDAVVAHLKTADANYQINLLVSVYNFLVAQEEVTDANYLAKKHLIPLTQANNKWKIAKQLQLFLDTSVGAQAPNFTWPEYDAETDTETTTSLNALKGHDNYVLVFWSSMCSHCLKQVPVLHKKIAGMDESTLKVLAIGLEDFEQEWAPIAEGFPKFTNIVGLDKWENEIGNKYDVTGTPTYYVLDSEKKITAKPETLEELLLLIDKMEE